MATSVAGRVPSTWAAASALVLTASLMALATLQPLAVCLHRLESSCTLWKRAQESRFPAPASHAAGQPNA